MSKQKIKKLILIIFLILVCAVLIRIYTTPAKQNTNPSLIDKTSGVAILEINDIKYQSEILGQTSVSDFMEKLKVEGKIDFKEKIYAGMGNFIDEINGIKNGNKNWIYYVNGKKANIGISNYKINPGDVVSWKYESSY